MRLTMSGFAIAAAMGDCKLREPRVRAHTVEACVA
jgi:hypothetical protein